MNNHKLVTDKFRNDQLFYAKLEGKFAALDEKKDRGNFWMQINKNHGRDSEYWLRFMMSYKKYEKL